MQAWPRAGVHGPSEMVYGLVGGRTAGVADIEGVAPSGRLGARREGLTGSGQLL